MPLPTVEECSCTAWYCDHAQIKCGNPVSVRITTIVSLGPDEVTEPIEIGICEDCYAKAQQIIPWAFPRKKT
jgi:hypothetical protein